MGAADNSDTRVTSQVIAHASSLHLCVGLAAPPTRAGAHLVAPSDRTCSAYITNSVTSTPFPFPFPQNGLHPSPVPMDELVLLSSPP